MHTHKVRNLHVLKVSLVWMTKKSIPLNVRRLNDKPIMWNIGDYYGRLSISRPRGISHD